MSKPESYEHDLGVAGLLPRRRGVSDHQRRGQQREARCAVATLEPVGVRVSWTNRGQEDADIPLRSR